MARRLGEAFVVITPDATGFREKTVASLKKALTGVSPEVLVQASVSGQKALVQTKVLREQIRELIGKAATVELNVKDAQGQAQILKFQARLRLLNAYVAKPGIAIEDKYKVLAEIFEINRALEKLNDTTARVSVGQGLAGRILGLGGGGGRGGRGVVGNLATAAPGGAPITGAAIAGIAGIAAFSSLFGAAGIIPLIVSATAAIGAFGALAIPTLSDLQKALSTVSTASDAYATASQNLNTAIHQSPADLKAYKAVLKGLEPDLAAAAVLLTNTSITWQTLTPKQRASAIALRNNAAAYKTLLPSQKDALNALLKEGNAWNTLTPGQQKAATGVLALSTSFDKLATAMAPLVLQVLSLALTVANHLLPALLPLATAAANAFQPLLKAFDRFATSPGFKAFIKNMSALAGPAILAIGVGFGKVTIALGKLLLAMESPDALRVLAGLFDVLAGAINVVAWLFKNMTPKIVKNFHDIASAFDNMRHTFAANIHQISDYIDTLRTVFAKVFHDMAGAFIEFGIIVAKGAKEIVGSFLNLVQIILTGAAKAFGWVPGVGPKLRSAAQQFSNWRQSVNNDFDKQIAKLQQWQNNLNASKNTAASATRQTGQNFTGMGVLANTAAGKVNALNQSLTRIPKLTTVNLHEVGVGNFTIGQGTAPGSGGGTRPRAAAGMYVAMGTGPTADDVLIRASKGELVVPANMVNAGAVDHLRGMIPGFASGGGIGPLAGETTGFHTRFEAAVTAAMERAMTAAMKAAVATAQQAFSVSGAGPLGGDPAVNMALARSMFPWPGSMWPAYVDLEMREAGFNRFATNPASGAYGIPQALPPTKMPFAAQAGGGSHAGPQISWMYSYIRSVYGDPLVADAHEQAQHWYARGGLIPGYATGGTTGGAPAVAALRRRLATIQARERAKYFGLTHSFAIGPAKYRTRLVRGELAVLAARQAAEVAAYDALAGRGLTGPHLEHLGAVARAELRTAKDKALNRPYPMGHPGFAADLRKNLTLLSMLSEARLPGGKGGGGPGLPGNLPPVRHVYGGDISDAIGAFISSVAAPFGAARGGLLMDRGGWLRPGWNATYNATGRPEHLVPAGQQVTLYVQAGSDPFEQLLAAMIKKYVKVHGAGNVQKAYGRH